MNRAHRVEVLVAGGGIAGAAAALAAAREGRHTALLEKTILPGGLATAGLIYHYLPLCDGRGTQVTFGLAEELLHAALRYGPGEVPADWRAAGRSRYAARFSPAALVLALDELLLEAGVEIWYDTLVCAPLVEGDRLGGVEVETKQGREAFRADCVIDATGDADVACRAGAECEEADNWLSLWALSVSLEAARRAVEEQSAAPLLQVRVLGGDNTGSGAPSEERKFLGTSAEEVTAFVLEGRRLLREQCRREQTAEGEEGRARTYPIALPSMAQLRTTRRILGRETLTAGRHNQRHEDSIGLVADWRRSGEVWEIPYGCLVPQRLRGLLAAGRCLSATGDAWEVTRVIPAAALTGEVAGLAAALALQRGQTPDQARVGELQEVLEARGMPCHLDGLTG